VLRAARGMAASGVRVPRPGRRPEYTRRAAGRKHRVRGRDNFGVNGRITATYVDCPLPPLPVRRKACGQQTLAACVSAIPVRPSLL
jgi:hypothetical protein